MFATILDVFKTTFQASRRSRMRTKPMSTSRLHLEALEDRLLPSYAVTDLGTLGGNYSSASDINALSQVVGESRTEEGQIHAFLWRDGLMTDLGTLGGASSSAAAINDRGQVVGSSQTGALDAFGNPIWHAFLWENGAMRDLGLEGTPTGMNAWGQVVGNDAQGAFLHNSATGTTSHLGTLPGGYTGSWAADINDAGQVVGTAEYNDTYTYFHTAFLWTPTTPNGSSGDMMSLGNPWSEASFGESFLGTPAGIESTFGTAINTAGEVAGYASGLYYSWWAGDAVYYDYAFVSGGANGIYTPLSNPLYGDTFAYDINDLGQVAGALGGITATVWQDGVFTDLHVQTGVNLNVANAINNAGQIVANGWNSQGQPHAFLLTRAVILRISNVTVAEGNTGTVSAVFSVSLSEPVAEVVTVSYSTADGTASDSDYQAVAGTLTFAPGETSKTVTVLVNGDRLGEPNETFVVNLSGATNATIADDQGVGTIFDDEPRISISDVSRKEGKRNQTTLFTFTVTLSAAYDQPVTMSFRTVNDTANTSNNDYVARSGTVTFAPGETTRTITVEVKGDSKGEADETFFLDLFGLSSNALFTRNRGLGTILNDD